jgi:hypothetical protein
MVTSLASNPNFRQLARLLYKQISDVGFSLVDFSGCFSNSVSKTKICTPI